MIELSQRLKYTSHPVLIIVPNSADSPFQEVEIRIADRMPRRSPEDKSEAVRIASLFLTSSDSPKYLL